MTLSVATDRTAATSVAVGIDVPYSDSWWLQRLYNQLRPQQKRCQALRERFEGNAPLPFVSDIQKDAVKWFVGKSRTNFERVIVNAVLSRLRIRGIRTAVDDDEGGDADAFNEWKRARGKLFTLDAHEMALSMSLAFLIIGKDPDGRLLVTAEDPRLVTVITDPANPYKVLAALKLFHDDVNDEDVAYLYLPGRVRVAKAPRKRRAGSADVRFNPSAYRWDEDIVNAAGELVYEGASGDVEWLTEQTDTAGNVTRPAMVPVVPFFNGKDAEHAIAQFEPFIPQIDRIFQQILQRMTIATIEAFRQRAIKGGPKKDPDTGEDIDYTRIFIPDPGVIWHLPETAEMWESGQVDLTPILAAIRDDVKDLYATSGTPGYLASPDAANSSAESASLQREMTVFNVEQLQDRFELSHEMVNELMFATLGDDRRAAPGTTEVIWAPAERLSWAEKGSAIAQTKGVIPRYIQLTEIAGFDPDMATRALSMLTDDLILDQEYAVGLKAATGSTVTNNVTNQNQ